MTLMVDKAGTDRMRGVRRLLISDGLLEELVAAANPKALTTVVWGEPDEDACYTPTITVLARTAQKEPA